MFACFVKIIFVFCVDKTEIAGSGSLYMNN